MSVSPKWIRPWASASSTIFRPILSFTDPPALKNSHLATDEFSTFSVTDNLRSSHFKPADAPIRFILTKGVCPMFSRMLGRILSLVRVAVSALACNELRQIKWAPYAHRFRQCGPQRDRVQKKKESSQEISSFELGRVARLRLQLLIPRKIFSLRNSCQFAREKRNI